MDRTITDEILEELSSALERVETQSSAILEFVKDKGIVKEDELAPYLERAHAASNVRWRAIRVRLEKLLSGLEKEQEAQEKQKEERQKQERRESAAEKARSAQNGEKRERAEKPIEMQASEEKQEGSEVRKPADSDNSNASGSRQQRDEKTATDAEQRPDNGKRPNAA